VNVLASDANLAEDFETSEEIIDLFGLTYENLDEVDLKDRDMQDCLGNMVSRVNFSQ